MTLVPLVGPLGATWGTPLPGLLQVPYVFPPWATPAMPSPWSISPSSLFCRCPRDCNVIRRSVYAMLITCRMLSERPAPDTSRADMRLVHASRFGATVGRRARQSCSVAFGAAVQCLPFPQGVSEDLQRNCRHTREWSGGGEQRKMIGVAAMVAMVAFPLQ